MRIQLLLAALAVWLAAVGSAGALDTVKTGKTAIAGQITGVSAEKVTITNRGVDQDVPTNTITAVHFEGEPPGLNLARIAINNGRYEDALEALRKIDPPNAPSRYVAQEIEFQKALCAARLALRGTGTIRDAGGQMARFVAANKDSYHWLEANRLVGDLLVANRQFAPAVKYYAVLAEAPWPEYKMQADVSIGRALLAEGKPAEAAVAFDRVIALASSDPAAAPQQAMARLGKARCLAAAGQTDQAVEAVQEIIAKTNPEDAPLQAEAYNTLGVALRKTGKTQDALLAFLHVDLLYFNTGESHAEALANLAELWNDAHQPQRAAEAAQLLKERYKNSRFSPP